MIKHLVFFKVNDGVEGRTKAQSVALAKQMVESMNGKIPGLIKVELGVDFSDSDDSSDMALYSEFESREAFDSYAAHPEHVPVLAFIKSIISERKLVDYEI